MKHHNFALEGQNEEEPMIEARKSVAAGVLYGVCILASGLMLAACGALQSDVPLWIICGACTAIIIGVFIDYLRTPMRPFFIDEYDRLVLHDGTVLDMKDVWDVSYRRATGRGVQYSWGSITINSGYGTLKYRYICDCEELTKSLLRLAYAHHALEKSE